jgi:hypothetical protein
MTRAGSTPAPGVPILRTASPTCASSSAAPPQVARPRGANPARASSSAAYTARLSGFASGSGPACRLRLPRGGPALGPPPGWCVSCSSACSADASGSGPARRLRLPEVARPAAPTGLVLLFGRQRGMPARLAPLARPASAGCAFPRWPGPGAAPGACCSAACAYGCPADASGSDSVCRPRLPAVARPWRANPAGACRSPASAGMPARRLRLARASCVGCARSS